MEPYILTAASIAAIAGVYSAVKQTKHSTRSNGSRLFIDTSVLIDGRIVEIAKSGFISDALAIPRSVVGELQLLADKGDSDKRTKARHGLDVITQLQALDSVTVEIFADSPEAREGVDQRLISLAQKHGGKICTVDFNLNKVAVVEGIVVCNVNELAKNLRMTYLPGETAQLHLTDSGQDRHQAVGHLEDGTMVVVEQAASQIGKVVEVEFIRGLQTDAGRMMFARLHDVKPVKQAAQPQPQPTQRADKPRKAYHANRRSSAKPAAVKKDSSPAAPARPARQTTTANKPKRTGKPKSRGQSNEDRLVRLANE